MHEFARKIGTLKDTNSEDGTQDTLKKLELLLMTDVSVLLEMWELYAWPVV